MVIEECMLDPTRMIFQNILVAPSQTYSVIVYGFKTSLDRSLFIFPLATIFFNAARKCIFTVLPVLIHALPLKFHALG